MKIRVAVLVSADSRLFQRSVALSGDQILPDAVDKAVEQCKNKLLADLQKPPTTAKGAENGAARQNQA